MTGRAGDGAQGDGLAERLQAALGDAYTIVRELGGGGMSRVFLAEERRLRRRVVVKLLDPQHTWGMIPARFERELRVTAGLQHPHVVPLLSAGDAGGIPYYTMPFVEGESLADRLARDGALPPMEAARLLREVADALDCAHALGIVHRDIKPANVLLSRGHALVADFGVAKAVRVATNAGEGLTSAGLAVGTPAYMAPEQAAGDAATDHRADLYALGVVAYELLSGATPFAGRTPQAQIAAHITEAPPSIAARAPGVPAALAHVVSRLLEKDPARRPQSAAEVVRALDAILAATPGDAPAVRTERPATRGRWRIAAAAAAVAVTAGALVYEARGSTFTTDRVAVVVLRNMTARPALDHIGIVAAEWIGQGLGEIGIVQVAGPPIPLPSEGAANLADLQHAVAQENGARFVVAGTVLPHTHADSVLVRAYIWDARGRELLDAQPSVVAGVADAMPAIDALRQKVMGAVAAQLDARYANANLVRPPRYDAYREYVLGQEASRRFAYREMLEHYERASALDPSFASAMIGAAYAHLNLGQCARTDSLREHVAHSRLPLTPYEGYNLDRAVAQCRGDKQRNYDDAQAMLRIAPKSQYVAWLAARSALPLNRPDEAARALERIDPEGPELRGNRRFFGDLTRAYHEIGEHEKELKAAQRARRLFPGVAEPIVLEVTALAAMGREAEVEERIREIQDAVAESVDRTDDALRAAAAEYRAHGRPELGAGMERRRIARWKEAPLPPGRSPPSSLVRRAVALENLGRDREAIAVADSLYAADSTWWESMAIRGRLAARVGDTALARHIDERLAAVVDPYSRGRYTTARAQIAAARGDRDAVFELLRRAAREGQSYGGLGHDPAFQSLWRDGALVALDRSWDVKRSARR